jgi:hypothetical protein
VLNKSETYNDNLFILQNHCVFLKNYAMALRKRVILIREGFALKTEHEKNEVDVIVYETLVKINVTEKKIQQLQLEYTHKLNAYFNDLEELNQQFEPLLELAKKVQAQSINIKHILYHARWKQINDDINEKIAFYKDLKTALTQFAKAD